ncbi:PilZ domain-containing protein [Bdellovibrio sp. HCB337]|uniref:PilZ domain-containing protein n=1 Tax=Bdellovibrio sp. HCB337 TaxID=3394358 RepID=UPI0039A43D8C
MKSEGKIWIIFDAEANKKTKPMSLVQAQMMILTFKVRNLHQYHIWTPGWNEWQPLTQFLSSNQKYFVQAQPPEPLLAKERQKQTTVNIKVESHDDEKTQKILIEDKSLNTNPHFTNVVAAEDFRKMDYGYYYNEVNGDDLTLSGLPDKPSVDIIVSRSDLGSPRDRRVAPRHDFKIEAVLLTKKGTSFRTHSKNISLSGTLLEDEIPKDFLQRPFEMILVNKFEKDPRKSRVHLKGKIIGDIEDPRRLMFLEQDEETAVKLGKLINDYLTQMNRMKKNAG